MSIEGLPDEILGHIASYLNPFPNYRAFCLTCRRFNGVRALQTLWVWFDGENRLFFKFNRGDHGLMFPYLKHEAGILYRHSSNTRAGRIIGFHIYENLYPYVEGWPKGYEAIRLAYEKLCPKRTIRRAQLVRHGTAEEFVHNYLLLNNGN